MARQNRASNMGTTHEREVDEDTEAAQPQVERLRGELARKRQELDSLLLRSETLHPSAYAALQGQLEEEIAQLEAAVKTLTQ